MTRRALQEEEGEPQPQESAACRAVRTQGRAGGRGPAAGESQLRTAPEIWKERER